ncbi:MAG: hypothetical protein P0S96_06145 [Simkaniaceae bacterium]|nr:hypothetical protein [Candidatus Sacchlamyda saccharinae]
MAAVSSTNPMVPVAGDPSTFPIAPDLHNLAEGQPWKVSSELFARVQAQPFAPSLLHKRCEVVPGDREYEFVQRAYEHSKPPGMKIKTVTLIHNPNLTTQFEAALSSLNPEPNPPTWKDHNELDQRQAVMERWEAITRPFQPVTVDNGDGSRRDRLDNVKILPLWHGTSKEISDSICDTGFLHFGKHSFFNTTAQKGAFASTDPGYFGSGKYFTTSARYAQMYNPRFLILSWVSTQDPFPVVNDCPHPGKGTDMGIFGTGRSGYQHYKAHYIPVANTRPDFPGSMEYYPCASGQKPEWDELVVFEKAQALPRYLVELASEGEAPPPVSVATVIPTPETKAGLNLVAICRNSDCIKHGNRVVVQKGFGNFDIGKVATDLACPCCDDALDVDDVSEIIVEDCKFVLSSIEQGGGKTKREKKLTGNETFSVKDLLFAEITTEKTS